ncbi:unnamed protein product, partial [Mesorhabditis belari]|uniref:Post-GPI attachment to proteins factor 3 n=1 Tax=Mesorhabditis belari TaxID=2138241 RepID=A0AAF3ERZ4_9BILA
MSATNPTIRITQPGNSPAKFHGEWPLAATQLGVIVIQKPASAIFSFINFVTTYLFWQQLGWRSNVQRNKLAEIRCCRNDGLVLVDDSSLCRLLGD